ncbi:Uncharacterised protein [Mycobacteroides abscessus subsp. massiliense]|uniref:hypothetical protein n=1 Tax=Mycobacteroides abscessus TaxID=36809 RepID=UPI0009CDAF67|nr:hypothetical protein [Mycobacteroides abscessus]SKF35954.1 Uncharacterised protein [Mycobacteroides abscessus subsp. massiliense]SKF43578.1 Uncharacterised protein [Mycobacteroides abscessus subsp. massiliense]SKF45361.1 Uncharacterised protein [Mycobacteroides abscessus subsp. massiliense]SKF48248.1 Uncharacterised protein [Mycobacteroides abscessus subsp. massiliense]SKF50143.1 Uncharacterised protein [Mycobacteroides abscessus subsp. massiliense]
MGWDSLPGTETNARPRLSLVAALQKAYPDAVAIDASVAKGRAYLAVRCADGQVRPVYLLLDREGFIDEANPTDDPVWVKHFPLDESPTRWPLKVAEALTTWEWT